MNYRQNWLDVRAYLHHCERVKQNDLATVSRYRKSLRHLLEWSDEVPLYKARNIDPTELTHSGWRLGCTLIQFSLSLFNPFRSYSRSGPPSCAVAAFCFLRAYANDECSS